MNIEENRLRTFSSWPLSAVVSSSRIAKAGFFYTGRELEVECFACGGKINDWNYGDQVMAKHRRLSAECPFVQNPSLSGNISNLIQTASSSSGSSEMAGFSEIFQCEKTRLDSFTNWPKNNIVSPQSLAKAGFYFLQTDDKVKCAFCDGICGYWEIGDDPKIEHERHFPLCNFVLSNFKSNSQKTVPVLDSQKLPKKPAYSALESRLGSFSNWDANLIQTPGVLAEAGFYFTGIGDQVRCFQCDGGLRHWDPDDEPWIEHARWFPNCDYVISKKGKEYIRRYTPGDEAPSFDRQVPRLSLEDQAEQDLNTAEAYLALSIGLPRDKVKAAIMKRLEELKTSYDDPDELINDTLNLPVEDDIISPSEKGISNNEANKNSSSNGNIKVTQENIERRASSPRLDLEEENRQLKEARTCKICLDNEIGIVFLPCGHFTACISCAPSLKTCPVCRAIIKGTVRTFIS